MINLNCSLLHKTYKHSIRKSLNIELDALCRCLRGTSFCRPFYPTLYRNSHIWLPAFFSYSANLFEHSNWPYACLAPVRVLHWFFIPSSESSISFEKAIALSKSLTAILFEWSKPAKGRLNQSEPLLSRCEPLSGQAEITINYVVEVSTDRKAVDCSKAVLWSKKSL